jgi:Phage integrase family
VARPARSPKQPKRPPARRVVPALKAHRSTNRIKIALKHLGDFFIDFRITDIDESAIERYVDHRREQGAAPATCNRELSALKLGLGILERQLKVTLRPFIELAEENNVREGFVTHDEAQRLFSHLPAHVRAPVECAYLMGWRLRSELLTRTRDDLIDLDSDNAHLYLDPKHSKNGEARRFYFAAIPRVREIIADQIAKADALELELGKPVTALFFWPDGKPLHDVRRHWWNATKAAGLDGLLIHDLRRSAVKNLNDAGIPREIAKRFTGHKSDAVYARYSIESDESLKLASAKLGSYLTARATKVVPLRTGTGK